MNTTTDTISTTAREWLEDAQAVGLVVVAHDAGLEIRFNIDWPEATALVMAEMNRTPGLAREVHAALLETRIAA